MSVCECVPAEKKKRKAHTKQEMQLGAVQSLKLQNAIASQALHACNSGMHARLFAYLQGTQAQSLTSLLRHFFPSALMGGRGSTKDFAFSLQ